MGININFQLAESLKFMEKRLIKVPRRKFIIFGLTLMLISSIFCENIRVVNLFSTCFYIGAAFFGYNTLYILYNKIYIFFHK